MSDVGGTVAALVHGCEWATHDERHRRLYVLHGATVTAIDTRTGDVYDRWPLDSGLVEQMGARAAVQAAVAERVSRGY